MARKKNKLSITELYDMYKTNTNFQIYVDKYCEINHKPLHEAMLHKIIEIKALDILELQEITKNGDKYV